MSNLINHAKKEFQLAGWLDEPIDEMQQLMMDNLLELLETFANQGHSGFSAGYCLGAFETLSRFNPLTPLTGEDDEWNDMGDGYLQNKRDSEVFKEGGECYWVNGIVFEDKDGGQYTNYKSRIPVEFPWTKPKSKVVKDYV